MAIENMYFKYKYDNRNLKIDFRIKNKMKQEIILDEI